MRTPLSTWLLTAMLVAVAAVPALASPGWLGVTTQATDEDLRQGLDLTRDGLLVNRVFDGSPAERAGLRKGDVILRFDGRTVSQPEDLRDLVRDAGSGRSVAVQVWRDGSSRTLNVRLGELPDEERDSFDTPVPPTPPSAPRAPRAPEPPRATDRSRAPELDWNRSDDGTGDSDGSRDRTRRRMIINGREVPEADIERHLQGLDLDGLKALKRLDALKDMKVWTGDDGQTFTLSGPARGRLGVRIEKLSDDLGQALGVSGDAGVLVLEVLEDTPAQKAGLRAGDVILEVEGHKVSDPDDLVSELGRQKGPVDIVVTRKGSRRTVQAELPERRDSGMPGLAPRARSFNFRIPEPDRTPRVYRRQTEGDTDRDADLREELRQLRRELRELREQVGEKK
jgi:hypothetical protein